MVGIERSFVCRDPAEFPDVVVVFISFEMLKDVTVCNDVLKGVIVHGAYELDAFRICFEFSVAVVDGANNPCQEALSVFLGFGKERASDEFTGVDDLELSLWDCVASPILNRFND
jgi:hypothetical protein